MALDAASMSEVLGDARLARAVPHSSIAIVQTLYAALARGAFEETGALMADDVKLALHDASGTLNGCWSGRDQVLAAIAANFAKVDEQKPELKSMIADGDSVAVLFAETGVVKDQRRPYTAQGVQCRALKKLSC